MDPLLLSLNTLAGSLSPSVIVADRQLLIGPIYPRGDGFERHGEALQMIGVTVNPSKGIEFSQLRGMAVYV